MSLIMLITSARSSALTQASEISIDSARPGRRFRQLSCMSGVQKSRIAFNPLVEHPSFIHADRINPTRRRTDASVESLRAPPESVRTGPIRHGSDRFDAPD